MNNVKFKYVFYIIVSLILVNISNTYSAYSKIDFYNKAVIDYKNKNYNEAKINFEKAIEIDSNYIKAWYALANCYRKLNDISNAKIVCNKLINDLKVKGEYKEKTEILLAKLYDEERKVQAIRYNIENKSSELTTKSFRAEKRLISEEKIKSWRKYTAITFLLKSGYIVSGTTSLISLIIGLHYQNLADENYNNYKEASLESTAVSYRITADNYDKSAAFWKTASLVTGSIALALFTTDLILTISKIRKIKKLHKEKRTSFKFNINPAIKVASASINIKF